MPHKLKILHLEDQPFDAELVERELKKGNIEFEKLVVTKKQDFETALTEFSPHIILSDHSLPSFNSVAALRMVKSYGIKAPFILVTATMSEEFAVSVIQQGGDDYILKSNLSRLPSAIKQAMDKRLAQQEKEKAELELKEAHEKLLFHLENSPLGYIEWDERLIIRSLSKKAEKIFGWNLDELKDNQSLGFNVVFIEDQQWVSRIVKPLLDGDIEKNNIQCRNYTKDGRVIWCEWFNSVLKNKDGEVIALMSLVQDITKRKIDEENLKRSLREVSDYKYVLDESSIVAITDKKGVIKYVNNNFCKISKYSREELIGQDHRIINSGYHPKKFIRNLWITIAKGKIWKGEFKNKAKDGSYYWVDSIIVPFLNDSGKPYQYVSIRMDITDRKKAEEALINNELRFREFFETAPEALLVIEPDSGIFVDYNDNALNLFKCTREELLKKSPADFSPSFQPDGKRSLEKMGEFLKSATGGERLIFDWVVCDSTGTEIFCEIRLNLLTNAARPLIRASVLDITKRITLERKLAEEELKKQQEITNAVVTAQERERAFLGEELHDNINQILATSMLYMDLAINADCLRKDVMTDSRNFVYIAMEEIRKLSKSLLPPSLGEISLLDALKELTGNIRQFNKLDFIEEYEIPDKSLLNEKLSLCIFRIVQEQLNNIFKYANAKTVIIGLKEGNGIIRLTIKDDGIGFDTNLKRKGIGLKNIVSRASLLNGKVSIDSRPGEGCELLVTFSTGPDMKLTGS